MSLPSSMFFFFFFTDTATTELYTLSLHDALPIWDGRGESRPRSERWSCPAYDRRWPSVLLKFAEGTVAPCAAAHKARACGGSRSRLSPQPPEQRTAAPSSPLRRRRLAFLPGEEAADVRAMAEDDEERNGEQTIDGVAIGGQRGDAERHRDSRQRPHAGDPQELVGHEPGDRARGRCPGGERDCHAESGGHPFPAAQPQPHRKAVTEHRGERTRGSERSEEHTS